MKVQDGYDPVAEKRFARTAAARPAGVTLRQTITLYAQAVLCLELPPKFRTRLLGTRRRRDLPIKPISPRKLLVLNRARFATSIQHGAQKSYAFGICVQSLGI